MTEDEVRQICEMCLGRWGKHLVAEHSTPIALVGVGHDQSQGRFTLCAIQGVSAIDLVTILASAAKMLLDGDPRVVTMEYGD